MKKKILAIAMFVALGLSASAQIGQYSQSQTDGFFANNDYTEYRESPFGDIMPLLPTSHGFEYDADAESVPVGSGLLLLGGMALAYGMRKKKD